MRNIAKHFETKIKQNIGKTVKVTVGLLKLDDIADGLVRLPGYQRRLREAKVSAMEGAFNGLAAGFVFVNERTTKDPLDNYRPGTRVLYDGNHRTEGAIRAGEKYIPMIFTVGLTATEEDILWEVLNGNRSNPEAVDRLKAKLFRKDSNATAICHTVHKYKYRLPFEGTEEGTEIKAIAALQFAFKREKLDDTLMVCSTAWPHDSNGNRAVAAVQAPMLKGIAVFLSSISGDDIHRFDINRFISRLASRHPGDLMRNISSDIKASGGVAKKLAGVMLDLYNGRARASKCIGLDFRSRGRGATGNGTEE